MRPIPPSVVNRILIRANNWIGDVVMISPAVRALREHFGGARIAILAKPWVLETLQGNPFYDDLIEYDDGRTHAGAAGFLRLVARLRTERFDLAILFQKAFEAAAIARLAGIPFRVGYATDSRSALLTHPLPLHPADTHHIDLFLGIPAALGCAIGDPLPFFQVDAGPRARAVDFLRNAGAGNDRPLVALHPGASKEPRAWHPERFAALGRRLEQRIGARVLLLAGPDDRRLSEEIRRGLPRDCIVPTGSDLTVRMMAGLLERCDLFVGNDSGPMHLAAALDVPTLAFFGPGTPRRTAPRARSNRVTCLCRDYPCSPCRQDFFRECPPAPSGKPFCLEEIRVEEAEAEALALLDAGPIRAPLGRGRAGSQPSDAVQT